MGALPVLQQGSRAPFCLSDHSLPLFYMNDFSVLGLLVSDLDITYKLLVNQNLAIERKADHIAISIERPGQMSKIVNLLDRNGIHCEITDIADQIYQG